MGRMRGAELRRHRKLRALEETWQATVRRVMPKLCFDVVHPIDLDVVLRVEEGFVHLPCPKEEGVVILGSRLG